MKSRIEINSSTPDVDVYKRLPSTDANSSYALTVEKLTIPRMTHGMVLNSPLFSIERRLDKDSELDDDDNIESVKLKYEMTFTPKDVQTVGQLAFQLNEFFKIGFIKNLKLGFQNYDNVQHPHLPNFEDFPDEFQRISDNNDLDLGEDWYRLLLDSSYTNKNLIQAVITPTVV